MSVLFLSPLEIGELFPNTRYEKSNFFFSNRWLFNDNVAKPEMTLLEEGSAS